MSSISAKIFAAFGFFLIGVAAVGILFETLNQRDGFSASEYLTKLAAPFLPNPELEQPLDSYMPAESDGWTRTTFMDEDYLKLYTPIERVAIQDEARHLSRLKFGLSIRKRVVYDNTVRVTYTYARGDETILINLLWADASRSRGYSGALMGAMQDGRRNNLDELPLWTTAHGLGFYEKAVKNRDWINVRAYMGRQVDIAVLGNVDPEVMNAFLHGLEIPRLNERMAVPLPEIDPVTAPIQTASAG